MLEEAACQPMTVTVEFEKSCCTRKKKKKKNHPVGQLEVFSNLRAKGLNYIFFDI